MPLSHETSTPAYTAQLPFAEFMDNNPADSRSTEEKIHAAANRLVDHVEGLLAGQPEDSPRGTEAFYALLEDTQQPKLRAKGYAVIDRTYTISKEVDEQGARDYRISSYHCASNTFDPTYKITVDKEGNADVFVPDDYEDTYVPASLIEIASVGAELFEQPPGRELRRFNPLEETIQRNMKDSERLGRIVPRSRAKRAASAIGGALVKRAS